MIPVKKIKLNRAEGPIELCRGDAKTFKTFAGVNQFIHENSPTYPKSGYDKHDFVVTWEDGFEYNGRLDLQHSENPHYNSRENSLNLHIKDFVEFQANDAPAPFSDENSRRGAREFLEKYALLDDPQPPLNPTPGKLQGYSPNLIVIDDYTDFETQIQFCPECDRSRNFIIVELPEEMQRCICTKCGYRYEIPIFPVKEN